jgi:hypothetical protein
LIENYEGYFAHQKQLLILNSIRCQCEPDT